MRRFLGLLTALALVALLAAPALAESAWENYKDTFSSGGYSGNDGSLEFDGDWYEWGDNGSPSSGSIRLANTANCPADKDCLRIGTTALVLLDEVYIKRYADTSIFTTVELCYEIDRSPTPGVGILFVEVSTNGGGSWVTVSSHSLNVGGYEHPIVDLTDYRSESFAVRFRVTQLLGGQVFIDNVEIKGELEEEPTTTTTTTTTTSSTTTTTTIPTTTTSKPTTTTAPTTTTTVVATTSSTVADTTSTTVDETSTTTSDPSDPGDNSGGVGPVPPNGGDGAPPGSVVREAESGVLVGFDGGLFGDLASPSLAVTGTDLDLNYKILAEIIEASWIWMTLLGLLMAWSAVSGLERRHHRKTVEA